ncbi:MAG: hypothetical protein VW518_01410 [Burkholderiaceae bacterium]
MSGIHFHLDNQLADRDLIAFTSIGNDGWDLHRLSTGDYISSHETIQDLEYEVFYVKR